MVGHLKHTHHTGLHNPISIRPGDFEKTQYERDNTMLPCGFTVAQSWIALRKLWLGYKINKVNEGGHQLMDYAKKINKVRRELGIPILPFDAINPTVLNVFENEMTTTEGAINSQLTKTCHYILADEKRAPIDERKTDYDVIMHEAFVELGQEAPPPSDDIFTKKISKKSCIYKAKKKDKKKYCLYRAK